MSSLCYLNETIGLDEAAAERNSPIAHLPRVAAPLSVVVGGAETDEFLRHSAEFAEAWRSRSLPGEHIVLPHLNHFTILDEMCLPESRLRGAIARLAG